MFDRKNILLYPLSLAYGLVTGIRNFMFDTGLLHSEEATIPVICIGNITIGGTGKTPHTEYLLSLLSKEFKTVMLSRGYMRKSKGFRFASDDSGVSEIGDEPMQVKQKFPSVTIAIDSDRVNGVKKIKDEKPDTEVVVMDDGFQHRKLIPGMSILLTDFGRLMIKDSLLPYGGLRESAANMRRADIILVTKSPANLSAIERRLIVKDMNKYPYQNLYFTSLVYGSPAPVFGTGSLQLSKEHGVVLVTGIANPAPLKEYLEKQCGEISQVIFPDHHDYVENDFEKINSAFNNLKLGLKCIITTEKDAVRLREFTNIAENLKSVFFFIPVSIDFLNEDREEFDNLVLEYVRKNKRNNSISQK